MGELSSEKTVGYGLAAASVAAIAVYGWLLFLPPREGLDILVLKLTAFAAVALALGLLAWIGYTLATTPPPKPIEELEKEIERELRRLEEELKREGSEDSSSGGETGAPQGGGG